MVQASADALIRRTPEQVFDFVAGDFYTNYPRWSPEVRRLEPLTPGPIRVGSRARQVRIDQGRRSETVFRVVDMASPSRIDFAESSDLFRIGYRMSPAGEGATRLTFSFELRRLELYMRPFEKLIRIAVQDGAERVVGSIRSLVEREVPPAAG